MQCTPCHQLVAYVDAEVLRQEVDAPPWLAPAGCWLALPPLNLLSQLQPSARLPSKSLFLAALPAAAQSHAPCHIGLMYSGDATHPAARRPMSAPLLCRGWPAVRAARRRAQLVSAASRSQQSARASCRMSVRRRHMVTLQGQGQRGVQVSGLSLCPGN